MASENLVFIVRGPRPSWKSPIELEELRTLAATRNDIEVRVGDTGSRLQKDMVVVDPTGNISGTLTLIDGRLQTKNPDEKTIEWMLSLADALRGRVVDGARRTYRTPHEKYIHSEDIDARKRQAERIKVSRNRFIPFTATVIRWAFVGFFCVLAMVLFSVLSR